MENLHEYIGFQRTGMIQQWLEANGWTRVSSYDEGDLYTKEHPVCLNTEAALFQELMDRASAHESHKRACAEARLEAMRYKHSAAELYRQNKDLREQLASGVSLR